LYEQLRSHLGDVFKRLAEYKDSRIEEGHLMPDHVHMLISIPPKHAVSQVVGYIKGKSAIHLARVYGERKRNFAWAAFLGKRLLRINSETRRTNNTGVYSPPKGRRQAPGSDESVVISGYLQVATKVGAA
jgi:putative transposase